MELILQVGGTFNDIMKDQRLDGIFLFPVFLSTSSSMSSAFQRCFLGPLQAELGAKFTTYVHIVHILHFQRCEDPFTISRYFLLLCFGRDSLGDDFRWGGVWHSWKSPRSVGRPGTRVRSPDYYGRAAGARGSSLMSFIMWIGYYGCVMWIGCRRRYQFQGTLISPLKKRGSLHVAFS